VDFTCEELKFYATEYFGNFGKVKFKWGLPGTGPMGRNGPFQENRPSDDSKMFGKVLVKFLEVFRTQIRDGGRALMMDLRDISGTAHEEVWNQAVYQYAIRYWQNKATDLRLTEGLMAIFANEDFMPPGGTSSGVPSDIKTVHGEKQAHPNGSGREQVCRFRVRFKNNGQLDETSTDNRWRDVKAKGSKLHAPRFAFIVEKPATAPDPGGDGNPLIDPKDVLAMLPVRSKFA
jgi:hypothetical protein